jgi:predicted KAP-like P-loop ATPase
MGNKSDNPHPSEWLSADKPIERRQDDVLGRRGFSEALADAIHRWSGQESVVLALYGAWGNGKSSIKNMVIDCLNSDWPQVLIVDFNPWQLANRPTLSEAFFDELGVALGKGDLGSNRLRRSVLARYRRWAHRLQGTKELVGAIRGLGIVLVFLGVAALGAALTRSEVISAILGSLLLLAGLLALVSKFVNAVIKFLEAGTEVGTKSISEIKAEIAKDLKRLRAPILVVLDDLDRLTPHEMLEAFQLIKANGDFPNLTYLVLCERAVVENNITKALSVPGRDYLEKIVQVAFDAPMIDVARVHLMLLKSLDSLMSAEAVAARFSEKRWGNMFLSSLHPYFETLRDVKRFISTLAFQISSFSVDGAFEVNPIDLIGLEVIRLFEPEVYKALQSSKEMLTSSSKPEKPRAEIVERALASIIDMGSEGRRDELRKLIGQLFPTVQWALGGPQYVQDYEGGSWYRDLRVCSSKVFDRYFRLALSDKELSQGSIGKLLRARGQRDVLRSELETLNSRGLLATAVEELGVHLDTIEPGQVDAFITAILDVADLLSDENRGIAEVPVHWRVGFLVKKAVEKLSDNGARLEVLSNAVANTNGLFMAVDLVALVGTPADGDNKRILAEAGLATLRGAAVRKIEEAASSGALAKHPKVAVLLSLWRQWGKNEDVARYIEALTETKTGTLQLLKSLVQRSLRQGINDYIGTERHYIRRNDVESLMPMDTLDARVQKFSPDTLSDEDQRAVTAFQKAMERRSAGKSDDDPLADD